MISVVVPVFNEEQSLEAFYKEVLKVLKGKSFELLFVDDGSSDRSLDILKKFKDQNKAVRIFSFRKNQGKAEALTLGFQKAKGDTIVTLDADLQDKPSEIPKLLKKLNEGWDLVSGWRKNRKDSFPKVLSSKVFNFLATAFWGTKINDLNSGLKVYKKEAARSLSLYGGMHRFIPLILYQEGFRITEVPVVHSKRRFGKSKYSYGKVFTEIPDMFTMLFLSRYAKRPLHFFGVVGGVFFLAGIIISIYLSILHFQGYAIGRRPLLLLGMLLILTGLQIFFTGFIADLIIHISQKNNKENTLLK